MSMIGRTIAHYTIRGKLGKGGMGEVHQATDTKPGRDVALKLVHEKLAGDSRRVGRFQREAQVPASLNLCSLLPLIGLIVLAGAMNGPFLPAHYQTKGACTSVYLLS